MNRVEAAAVRHARALDAFAEIARRYCERVEDWWALPDQYNICARLADLEQLLPKVMGAAAVLRPTGDWFFDDETSEEEAARGHPPRDLAGALLDAELMQSLNAVLGRFAYYGEVIDPTARSRTQAASRRPYTPPSETTLKAWTAG